MPPPPPPLGRARKRDAQLFDSALCDTELVDVRAQFTQGRWAKARTLLVATGDDWDRRGHRLVVLAETPAATAWAREWLLAEPESADAVTLLACAAVFAALRRKGTPEAAEEACRRAAVLLPADPTPGSACCSSPAPSAPKRSSAATSTRSGPATANTTTPTT